MVLASWGYPGSPLGGLLGCLGRLEAVLGRSWGLFGAIFELFWAVWRPSESDPKTTVLATSHFFEDVSSEIALFVRTTS